MPVETVRGDPTAWIRQHNFQSAAIPTNASAAPDPGGTHPLVMASRVYLLHAKKQGRRKPTPFNPAEHGVALQSTKSSNISPRKSH
jgi:hypothetical protein